MTITFCASAIGPLPLAVFRELTGSYTVGMVVMMALPALSVVALTLARPGEAGRPARLPATAPED